MYSRPHGKGSSLLVPQHNVELEHRLMYAVEEEYVKSGKEIDLTVITPVRLKAQKKYNSPLRADVQILLGRYAKEGYERYFYVPSDQLLKDMLKAIADDDEEFFKWTWGGLKIETLDVLIRRSWSSVGTMGDWHDNEKAVEAFVRSKKEQGAYNAWVRGNNGPHLRSAWGVEYELYPLNRFIPMLEDQVKLVAEYIEERKHAVFDYTHRQR